MSTKSPIKMKHQIVHTTSIIVLVVKNTCLRSYKRAKSPDEPAEMHRKATNCLNVFILAGENIAADV